MRAALAALLFALPFAGLAGDTASRYAGLPGGLFKSALQYEDAKKGVRIAPFALMRKPVTNAEFLAFVRKHPQWQRDRVASVFAEPRYLSHWQSPTQLGPQALPQQPVVWVSWFAANAYCESSATARSKSRRASRSESTVR